MHLCSKYYLLYLTCIYVYVVCAYVCVSACVLVCMWKLAVYVRFLLWPLSSLDFEDSPLIAPEFIELVGLLR